MPDDHTTRNEDATLSRGNRSADVASDTTPSGANQVIAGWKRLRDRLPDTWYPASARETINALGATLRNNRPSARLTLAAVIVCALGVVAAVESTAGPAEVDSANPSAQADLLRRADALEGATRSERDAPAGTAGGQAADPAAVDPAAAQPAAADPAATDTTEGNPDVAAADPDVADPDVAEQPAAPTEEPAPTITPVAGLSQVQMENATMIVDAGLALQMPRRAMVIAVATAMQESTLLNRASEVLPESKNYPHQGTGWDHDSVGLFQQRTSTGWGAVADLMNPTYSATQFYLALQRVPGWQQLRLTEAAQAVQVSAFPEHYAKHETAAEAVVTEILAAR
jgi:hypothetical protein